MRRYLPGLLLALAACGGGPGSSGSHTINYYFTAEPRSLDPALSTDVPTGEVVAMLFSNLTRFDVDGNLKPALAERWEISSDGLEYTFHLRSGVTFQNGRPLTARDIEASYLRVLSPSTTGGRNWPLLPIAGARQYADGKAQSVPGISVPDDSTVVFRLEEPLNIFPKLLAMPVAAIVPTPTPPGFDQHPVGSGPWKFVSWSHDDQIVLAKNPSYWGGAPKADTLRIRIIPEPLTQAAEYLAGRLDVVEIPFGETARWESDHANELQRRPAIRDLYIAINTTRGPLKDVRVRRALNHAVDVQTILKTVMSGRGVQAAGAIPPGITGYDSTRAPYSYDPALARKLLAEAGYPNGFSVQLWRTQRAELARVAQAVQSDLAQVGVKVEIVERDASTARAAARSGKADLFLTDWYADYPDPENFTYPLFYSKNAGLGGNYARYSDPELDRFILQARTTTDSGLKASVASEIDSMVYDAAPWIFLWFPVDLWAERPDVTGWHVPLVFYGQDWTAVQHVTPQ
jgi:peptide/nickel transport system substrate-binding protein/oligopeptide transport system substrate-binding protein